MRLLTDKNEKENENAYNGYYCEICKKYHSKDTKIGYGHYPDEEKPNDTRQLILYIIKWITIVSLMGGILGLTIPLWGGSGAIIFGIPLIIILIAVVIPVLIYFRYKENQYKKLGRIRKKK